MISKFHYIVMFIYILNFFGCSSNNKSLSPSLNVNKKVSTSYFFSSSDIAIVFPSQVIGKYAIESTNASLSYLIYKNSNFRIKVFDTIDESEESIKNVFTSISNQGISKVLVLLTYDGAKHLKSIANINSFNIYLPLIHKDYLNLNLDSVTYGSIDYSKQLNELLLHSSGKNVEFHDNSGLGNRLISSLNNKDVNLTYTKEISNENNEYGKFINDKNKKLIDSTLIVNMPIVKSSIILSQVNANDINISTILSTQLNYTPLLLSLTQIEDRQNMIIANSITKQNQVLEEYNALLGNDIIYNWVNFSSIIGIEYLSNGSTSEFDLIDIKNNQVQYPIELYKTTKHSFIPFN